MGASAVGFSLPTRRVRGVAIVELLERGAACLFVAVSGVDPVMENSIRGSLRAVFITLDGSRHEVQAQAGGGPGLLFHSPDDVPLEELSRCVIQRAADAPWLDG